MDDHQVFKIEEKKPHRYGTFRFFIAGFALLQGIAFMFEIAGFIQVSRAHPIGMLFYLVNPAIILTLCYFAYRLLDDIDKILDKQEKMVHYLSVQRKKEERAAAAPATSSVRKLPARESSSS